MSCNLRIAISRIDFFSILYAEISMLNAALGGLLVLSSILCSIYGRNNHPSHVLYGKAGEQLTGTAPSTLPPDERSASEKLFYIYDLPQEFWWKWPKPSANCSETGYLGHEHAINSGMGPPVIEDDGLFLTWHFSLFSSMYNRMKRSKRRTFDPEKADLFIIPYDLGLDGYLDDNTCRTRRGCTKGLVGKLEKYLTAQKYWQRHQGGDHVVLWSLGNYHPWPRNGCDVFMKDFCRKCTITCYWMDPSIPEHRFISVPFPGAYHWHDNIKNIPWDTTDAALAARKTLAVYLGSTHTLNPYHTKIRRAMAKQCEDHENCEWMQIAHSSKDMSIGDFLSVYRKATFCLCPPGDDPARKAVFDAILSGCIPVIFHESTLFNQYPWHFDEGEALGISISVPGNLVRLGTLKFMEYLKKVPPSTIRAKQEEIKRLAPRIQYSLPPLKDLKNISDATPWDPPFQDGVDRIIDGCFNRAKYIIRNQTTGMPRRTMNLREWGAEYNRLESPLPGEAVNRSAIPDGVVWNSEYHMLEMPQSASQRAKPHPDPKPHLHTRRPHPKPKPKPVPSSFT